MIARHSDSAGSECVLSRKHPPKWSEQTTRAAVKGRSGDVCEYCQQHRAEEMHHRVSRGTGGPWTPGNIVHLCSACHGRVTHNPVWAYQRGLSVKRDDPEIIEVRRANGCVFQPTSAVCGVMPAPRRPGG